MFHAGTIHKSIKPSSDGDDDSLESNPAYDSHHLELEHYTTQKLNIKSSSSDVNSSIEIDYSLHEPQVIAGSVDSTSSSVYYSKPTFNEMESEGALNESDVYYSQPFSSHLSVELTGDAVMNMISPDTPPPLPKSRDGDGITTVPNISYQRILSNESRSQDCAQTV